MTIIATATLPTLTLRVIDPTEQLRAEMLAEYARLREEGASRAEIRWAESAAREHGATDADFS